MRHCKSLRISTTTTSAFVVALCFASPCFADWRDDIGHTKLLSVLGSSAPNGAGVPISIVEAGEGAASNFFPDVTNTDFSADTDPQGLAVNFINGSSSVGNSVSGHSNTQSRRFFGNTSSIAPAANEVTVYEANDYLNNVLRVTSSNSTLPITQNFRVQNFSWIGTFATLGDSTPEPTVSELNKDREALRRFDYLIDNNNVTAVVGLQNAENPLPRLLTHSYNAISVGRTIGGHGVGLTHLSNYGVGRSKPDLVAPFTTSSGATAATSSAATFLHSSDTVRGTEASNSEVMKAILLAGASKEPFTSWSQIDAEGEWHPLDDTFGAGELNTYNSYLITLGGKSTGEKLTPSEARGYGWDYQTIQPGAENELLYDFVIPEDKLAAEISIALTWNAIIESPFHVGDPIVANLDLSLVDSTGMPVDFDLSNNYIEGLSQSSVDNVEHIYLEDVPSGAYTLKVVSQDLASDFGLAWRVLTEFETPTADFDEDGDVDGADFLTWQRNYGSLINASRAEGDADGDGDVDDDDLDVFRMTLHGTTSLPNTSLLAVPEANTNFLLGLGLFLILITRFGQNWFRLTQPTRS